MEIRKSGNYLDLVLHAFFMPRPVACILYATSWYLGFFLGALLDLRGPSMPAGSSGSLSSRSTVGNCSFNISVLSHVASSAGNRFQCTKLSSTNLLPCLIQRVSMMCAGSSTTAPSLVTGGKLELTAFGSPTYFFSNDT